jgi:hypothetical protein
LQAGLVNGVPAHEAIAAALTAQRTLRSKLELDGLRGCVGGRFALIQAA